MTLARGLFNRTGSWIRTLAAALVVLGMLGGAAMAAPGFSVSQPAGAAPAAKSMPDDGRFDVALSFFEKFFRLKREPKKPIPPREVPKKRSEPAAPREPYIKTVEKDADAAVIAVFGDEFSQDMAWGLKDAFSEAPDVKVEVHSVDRSGLVTRASRNPLSDSETFFKKHPFNFAVVMVGLNDRVAMPPQKNDAGEVVFPEYEFRSEGWRRSYGRRIDQLREALAKQDKPVYWVGLPPVADKAMSDDLLYLNDFISERLTNRSERFIDIWNAFADEEGAFVSRGPDLAGEEKRLRQRNGIRFNKDGRRKLAYFVEKLVVRTLSQSVAEDVLPDNLDQADETALREGRGANRDIFALRKPPLESEQLIDPSSFSANADSSGLSRQRAPDLRADNFVWDPARQ